MLSINYLVTNFVIQNQLVTNSNTGSILKLNVRDLESNCQDHAAILGKYLPARNFGTEQASNMGLVSSMDKSGAASRLAS